MVNFRHKIQEITFKTNGIFIVNYNYDANYRDLFYFGVRK